VGKKMWIENYRKKLEQEWKSKKIEITTNIDNWLKERIEEMEKYLEYFPTAEISFEIEPKSTEELLKEMGFVPTDLKDSFGTLVWKVWVHKRLPFFAKVGTETHYESHTNRATHMEEGRSYITSFAVIETEPGIPFLNSNLIMRFRKENTVVLYGIDNLQNILLQPFLEVIFRNLKEESTITIAPAHLCHRYDSRYEGRSQRTRDIVEQVISEYLEEYNVKEVKEKKEYWELYDLEIKIIKKI